MTSPCRPPSPGRSTPEPTGPRGSEAPPPQPLAGRTWPAPRGPACRTHASPPWRSTGLGFVPILRWGGSKGWGRDGPGRANQARTATRRGRAMVAERVARPARLDPAAGGGLLHGRPPQPPPVADRTERHAAVAPDRDRRGGVPAPRPAGVAGHRRGGVRGERAH